MYLHVLCSLEQSTHILFPRSPCPQYSNCVSFKSLTIQPNQWPQPKNSVIDSYFWPSLLLSKMSNQVHCQKFCHLGRCLFIIVLQGCPRVGLQCCSCLLLDAACVSYNIICKPSPSFFLQSQSAPHEATRSGGQRVDNVAGIEALSTWVTASCNLFVSLGPAQT